MNYGLNDRMPLFPLLLYGLQWLVISIPSIIILGAVTASMNQEGAAQQILYIQKLVATVGGGLIIQMLWGHRLPLVMGPASVLLVGIISATAAHADAVNTAIVLGGALLFGLGISGMFDKVQSVFTPRIVAVILALIAFTLSPVIAWPELRSATNTGVPPSSGRNEFLPLLLREKVPTATVPIPL